MNLSQEELLKNAQKSFLEQKPIEAFRSLRWILEYPHLEADSTHEKEAFSLFAKIGEQISGKEFAKKIWIAIQHPRNPQILYHLGYELIEQQLPGIAATVLARAHQLEPENESILTELCIALEDAGQHFAAYLFLKKAENLTQTSFFCRYLLAFNALMIPKIEEAQELIPGLEQLCKQEETIDHAFMLEQIKQMLSRVEAVKGVCSLNTEDLRGWHFVTNGGILLHLSPYSFDEGMHGRYAFIQDSEQRCKEGILRLQVVLKETQNLPSQIFLLPDRNSTILGLAASQLLGIPAKPWPVNGADDPGLIVVYDLHEVESTIFHSLKNHKQGQILYCHASNWIERQSIVGDITMYLYQMNNDPWAEKSVLSRDAKEVEKQPKVTDAAEVLAQKIVNSQVLQNELEDLPFLQKFVSAIAKLQGPAAAGMFCSSGHRRRQRTDSPVKSNEYL